MAATLTQERFTGPEWTFERKLDGIRLMAFKQGDDVRLFSRTRQPRSDCRPSQNAIAELPAHDIILDGELTWESGVSNITCSTSSGSTDATSVGCRSPSGARLLDALPLRAPLHRVRAIDDAEPWERACAEGWEGVIAKRLDSPYEQQAIEALAQDEVRDVAGLRRRRLHRPARRTRRTRRSARRLFRRRRLRVRRQGRNWIRYTECSRTFARASTRWRSRRRRSRGRRGCRVSARIGSSPRSSCTSRSSSGPCTASCDTRGSLAERTGQRGARRRARIMTDSAIRDHASGEGDVSGGRHHQGRARGRTTSASRRSCCHTSPAVR